MVSNRSRVPELARISSTKSLELLLEAIHQRRQRRRCLGASKSKRTPPRQAMPRSRRLPVSSSLTRSTRSLSRIACMLAVTNATSVQIAPMSATWL